MRKWECQAGASPLGKEESATRWEIGAGVPVCHAVTSVTLWEVLTLGIVRSPTFSLLKNALVL